MAGVINQLVTDLNPVLVVIKLDMNFRFSKKGRVSFFRDDCFVQTVRELACEFEDSRKMRRIGLYWKFIE
jgi:hypothetical protein